MKQSLTQRIQSLLTNPYKLFAILTHHGFFAHMEDKRYLRLLYGAVIGKWPDLDHPTGYNEKLQWLKIHDKNPAYPMLADKIAVREYVDRRAGAKYLAPLLGVWDDPDDIDFSALPKKFVLKCTHDSSSTILCSDKNTLDPAAARRALKKKLGIDYAIPGREWPYALVPRRVMAETYLESYDGRSPAEYKFFCFNGKARVVLVGLCNQKGLHENYTFSMDFEYLPVYELTEDAADVSEIRRPLHFAEMAALAETLSTGFRHMRVDLYDTPDGVRFGEITLHSSSGLSQTMTEYGNRLLGGYLDIEA